MLAVVVEDSGYDGALILVRFDGALQKHTAGLGVGLWTRRTKGDTQCLASCALPLRCTRKKSYATESEAAAIAFLLAAALVSDSRQRILQILQDAF